jgi:hypothetical protein
MAATAVALVTVEMVAEVVTGEVTEKVTVAKVSPRARRNRRVTAS